MTKSFKTLLVLINFLAIPALSFAQVTVIAEDDFESGGWSGGTGWSGDWIHSSRAYVHSDMSPYEGTYHLKLRKNGNASRTVDMTGKTNARASFYWKAFHWEAGDRAAVMIYDGAWHNILAKSDGDDDNLWHFADIDLSIYNMISDFQIKVIQYCRQTGDYFYIDNLEITADGDPTPSPAVYYIDPAGDDTNPGTSEATPWQTLAKVNATTFSPGDTILFKANCSWIGTLWPKG